MKSLLTYYSFSGNTDKVMQIFGKILTAKGGEVDIQRLRPQDEIKTFIGQCQAAWLRKRAALPDNVKFDAASYDLVLIGSPVWAFAPTPAMNAFLDKLSGLNGKRAIVLLTSGSGVGVQACFKNIRKILESKGVSRIDEINIPDRKQGDGKFIAESIESVI